MLDGLAISFNEAEALKPRIQRTAYSGQRAGSRFNEAEALKPRIPRTSTRKPSSRKSFNEAEALKPRIRTRALAIGRAEHGASMRPRH